MFKSTTNSSINYLFQRELNVCYILLFFFFLVNFVGKYRIITCLSWLITGFETRLMWWVPLVEQELLTLPEHLSSSPVISGVRGTRSLVLYVCFVDRCLSFCTFFFLPLCCRFLFDIWIRITPLVSSNSSYHRIPYTDVSGLHLKHMDKRMVWISRMFTLIEVINNKWSLSGMC